MSKNVRGWPVMKSKCASCPFGENGNKQVEAGVIQRIVGLEASQICHHPALLDRPETHLCRGARDLQLVILHAYGLLSEPTDEAFTKTSESLGVL